jgi:two-component system, sporulation sensor kinase D
MLFTDKQSSTRWLIIIISFVIVLLILWNTYIFFQIFKQDERLKMNLWAQAQKTLINADQNTDVELPLLIFSNNNSIPIILTENDSIINTINIESTSEKLNGLENRAILKRLIAQNEPIVIEYVPGQMQKLYYGDSALLTKLKYYPLALILIIILFGAVVYNFYKSTKVATQNKLWAGMAKETAHQIGTPLSSLIGWVEILKADQIDEAITSEIEKDIQRLLTITDRFSKIGSVPLLENIDIVQETVNTFEYLETRFSKQVSFKSLVPKQPYYVAINATLHSWVIENLVKNAIDAMKGKGNLALEITVLEQSLKIWITDSGTGLQKKQFKTIFEPGYTTKKRGWGLGLSLTKRIVEEYHKGKIKVLRSQIGVGTTFEIEFKTI